MPLFIDKTDNFYFKQTIRNFGPHSSPKGKFLYNLLMDRYNQPKIVVLYIFQIAFFSLRRLHADFHFELCSFYRINLRQLLTLLFKTTIFLIIQIQFNINTISQAFKD